MIGRIALHARGLGAVRLGIGRRPRAGTFPGHRDLHGRKDHGASHKLVSRVMSISSKRPSPSLPPTMRRSSMPQTGRIEALKTIVAALQKSVDELQAAQKKTAEDSKKADAGRRPRDGPAAKDGAR